AGLGQVCYAVSCPVSLAKQDWYNILKLRTVHALKQCSKCTDKEIRDFANNSMRMQVCFEEKILIFLITPRPEQKSRFLHQTVGVNLNTYTDNRINVGTSEYNNSCTT
uniref:Uncharacterized protein n=1 Tax=Romanomermis culicivorax TaxID=13658 RepID=A0A915HVR4_ROMCU